MTWSKMERVDLEDIHSFLKKVPGLYVTSNTDFGRAFQTLAIRMKKDVANRFVRTGGATQCTQ